MVAIARALASNARIMFMDEPTSSLFDDAVERLFRLIEGLKQSGVAIVYVSHRMDEIFRICDRATVLRDGVTVGTRVIAETNPDELIRMMVGRDLESDIRRVAGSEEPLLSVKDLTTKNSEHFLRFASRRGAGHRRASGCGAQRDRSGAVRARSAFERDDLPERSRDPSAIAREAIRLGIALLPEDRKARRIDDADERR